MIESICSYFLLDFKLLAKSALKEPAHDSAKLLYMELRPPVLFFSSILFLLYFKKSKPWKFLPVLGLPSPSCCKLFTFAFCNFFLILPLFHKDARANKQNESTKKLNHNLKAWRRVSETGARRSSQVLQIFSLLWVFFSNQDMLMEWCYLTRSVFWEEIINTS